MIIHKKLKPFMALGPGYTIKRYLSTRGWTQNDLAKLMSMSPEQIRLIITNQVRITRETARLLSQAFHNNPQFWINLDTQYQVNVVEKTQQVNKL